MHSLAVAQTQHFFKSVVVGNEQYGRQGIFVFVH
jgi:hypothetical protein